jgi:hypothetical protein
MNFALEFMNIYEDKKRRAFIKVAKNCMNLIFFMFRDKFDQQTTGTSMGNPLSPIIANIFISRFETNLAESNLLPRIWVRYVDDVFAVLKKSQ